LTKRTAFQEESIIERNNDDAALYLFQGVTELIFWTKLLMRHDWGEAFYLPKKEGFFAAASYYPQI